MDFPLDMPPKKDLTGKKFGRWTVLEELPERINGNVMWKCICDCGTEGVRQSGHFLTGKSTSCGCKNLERLRGQVGVNSPGWKGGKRTQEEGYIEVYRPGHPDSRANGYIKEHRLVMESMIGRRLLPEETVHHKDGNRSNNSKDNLELWSSSHPKGQRVEDKIKWAQELLELYKDWSD